MNDTELIRPIREGDEVFFTNKFKEYTPYSEGGPITVTSIFYSSKGKATEYQFQHIKNIYSRDLRTFNLACINIKKTNEHLRNSIYKIKTAPTLPDI